MKQVPAVYSPSTLQKWDCQTETAEGNWIPARPYNYCGIRLIYRLRIAWRVFCGTYDALDWSGLSSVSGTTDNNTDEYVNVSDLLHTKFSGDYYIVDHIASKYHNRVGSKITTDGYHISLEFPNGDSSWFNIEDVKPSLTNEAQCPTLHYATTPPN